MKKNETIGHGINTATKQVSLKEFCVFYADILENIRRKSQRRGWITRHLIYDLYAGKGECPSGEDGSAITFSEMAKTLHAKTYFCEENLLNAESLQLVASTNPLVKVNHGRWQDASLPIPTKNDFGICYIDPNGLAEDLVKLNQRMECKKSRVDILFRVGATWYKRQNRSIAEITETIEKKHWIICPIETDHPRSKTFQDMFLMGSNWIDLPAWKSKGWMKLADHPDEWMRRAFTKKQIDASRYEHFHFMTNA